jgi:outer membrane receptor for ferrienterochelin and colicins
VGQPPSTYWNASGTADFDVTKKVVARFFGDYRLREVRNYYFSGATQLASTVYDSQRDLTRFTLSPEVELLLAPRTTVNATYTYGKYLRDETRVFVSDGRVVPQPPWREWNQEAKLTARHAWTAFGREQPLQGGYEYRSEKLQRGTMNGTGRDCTSLATTPVSSECSRDINVLWGQQELDLTPRLKLTGGLRYDSYSDFGHEWSPKAEAVFSVAPGHRLRASYGHGFRPPYFGELYLLQPPFFVGNPDLVPEVSDGFTGGYAFASGKAQVSVDGYYTRVKNGIDFYQLTPSQYTYKNIARYDSKGVNVAASVNLPWGFTPSVAYTYNEREDPQGVEIGGYPNNSAFVKILWTNPRLGLRANFRGQINGKEPPSLEDGTWQPAYTVWYAQVSKRFATLGAYGATVYVQVDNIFDKGDIFLRNPDGTPVQGEFQVWLAPRTFQAGITLDMDW